MFSLCFPTSHPFHENHHQKQHRPNLVMAQNQNAKHQTTIYTVNFRMLFFLYRKRYEETIQENSLPISVNRYPTVFRAGDMSHI